MEKSLLGQRFAAALESYEHEAVVQAAMAHKLVQKLKAVTDGPWSTVLELGCGNGNLTRRLLETFSIDTYWCNDLTNTGAYLRQKCSCPPNQLWRELWGDAEDLPWPGELDVVCSNATVQWFENPERFLIKAAAALRPGGWLAFTSFLPGHFAEFRTASQIGLTYPTAENWLDWLQAGPWQRIEVWHDEFVEVFDQPRSVLKHIQATGVGAVQTFQWTKSRLQQFGQTYPQRDDGQYGLTYRPFGLIAQRLDQRP